VVTLQVLTLLPSDFPQISQLRMLKKLAKGMPSPQDE
jgi:hypothetical protein